MNKVDSNNYIQTTLGQLVSKEKKSIISGPFGSNIGKIFFKEQGIPVIRGNNLSTGGEKFKDDGFVYITREKADELNCFAIKNDLIFTAVGTIGQVGIIGEKLKYNEYVISNKQLRVRFDNDKITPLFAYYWFSSYWIQKLIIQRNVGSTVPLINLSVLKGLPITLPKSISIQNRIVEVLENISIKIELNNRINVELKAMAKTLYDYWFVQFDFPDKSGSPYKTSGGKMVWNESLKREIPDGWEIEPLFKAMDVQYGFPFSTSKFTDEVTDKPVIRIRDILENTISTYTSEEVDDKYRLKQNDLLIGMDGNFHLNFWDKDGAYLNQRSVRIRAKKDSEISNLQAYFELKPYIKARENNVSRTTVGHLSDKDLKRLFLISPSRSDLFKPKNLFENSLSEIISNRLQNQKLTELRDWLLPMLMNGQVKVR